LESGPVACRELAETGGDGAELPEPVEATLDHVALPVRLFGEGRRAASLRAPAESIGLAGIIPMRAEGAKPGQWAAAPNDGFHVLRHTYARSCWRPESPS
jgi:hypothetical protein